MLATGDQLPPRPIAVKETAEKSETLVGGRGKPTMVRDRDVGGATGRASLQLIEQRMSDKPVALELRHDLVCCPHGRDSRKCDLGDHRWSGEVRYESSQFLNIEY